MSVAFRRDGDDEHLEPKFEIPIPPGPNLVTERGLALIGEKLAALEVELAKGGEEAQINALKRELRYWTTRQITAELVPAPDGSTVAIGTRVAFTLNGKRRDLSIVGDDEADPAQGSIAFSAPLARSLIGGEEGELLPFNGKEDAIEVLEIAVI
ncbi:GreA/GreB family elongation factor [Novosphingobium terrae]|uniref:GreA/GreB family elongation factor n=1 Tax=Novosphingobium terrae TaxID=2726189 RepID=UPI0019807B18|nr:GreA/GreB family elongation factor [Novosphingobium terrae]